MARMLSLITLQISIIAKGKKPEHTLGQAAIGRSGNMEKSVPVTARKNTRSEFNYPYI